MEVKLKVLVGPNAGKEVPVVGPKFLVGRAEDCQLRPRSDLISRHHCVLMIEDALVIVRDFGSKNGTLVNGERVMGELELSPGDRLQIGPLDFEVCIRTGIASKKRPKVEGVKDAAARTAAGNSGGSAADLDDVSQWIKDGDEEGRSETRRLNINETEEIDLNNRETHIGPFPITTPGGVPLPVSSNQTKPNGNSPPTPAPEPAPEAAPASKAPAPHVKSGKDSGQAATDVLNKFFRRR